MVAIAGDDRGAEHRGIAPRLFVTLGSLIVTASLSACAAPTAYMGISLTPGAADPQIQTLARQAQSGDKHAQLALGIAYEEGGGVPQNLKRARKLYRLAATPSGGTIYVYFPPMRKGGKGNIVPVNMGPLGEGLADARSRLLHKQRGKHGF